MKLSSFNSNLKKIKIKPSNFYLAHQTVDATLNRVFSFTVKVLVVKSKKKTKLLIKNRKRKKEICMYFLCSILSSHMERLES